MWPLATQYRTGSGSDLVVYEILNYAHVFILLEKRIPRAMRFDPVATAPGSVLSGD